MDTFEQNGYQILRQVIDSKSIILLKEEINRYIKSKKAYGIRDLHLKIKAIADLAVSNSIKDILQRFSREKEFQLIKAIFFNKSIQNNWSVPWHQDKTIAVKEKAIVPGFKNWTSKQGVPHVQPSLSILEKIISNQSFFG